MRHKIIHIVNDLSKVSFGIWNAAIAGACLLAERHGIETEVWVCDNAGKEEIPFDLPVVWLGKNRMPQLMDMVALRGFGPDNSVIVSHGCWLMPTRIGHELNKLGFRWIYVPHGMLEPWSMAQGRLKKFLYFHFIEKRLARKADVVRAVSSREKCNLQARLNQRVSLIENGIDMPIYSPKADGAETFLFMARLHHKKGILPLVQAWKKVMGGSRKQLIIAGPDEGELKHITPYLSEDILYVGAVYGEKKAQLLRQSHYYVLPSHSEGFPTSVIEAMGFGLIPLISQGCNFSEVFSEKLGYEVEPSVDSISACFMDLKSKPFDSDRSLQNHQFIRENYSMEQIGEKLFLLYKELRERQRSVQHGEVL